jgi:F-type H+-transporting ATPase subunit a
LGHGIAPIFKVGPVEITNTVFTAYLVSIVLLLLAFLATRNLRLVPGRLQSVFELVISQFLSIGEQVADARRARRFLPLVATLFLWIWLSNWIGILPLFGEGEFYVEHDDGHGHVEHISILRSANTDLNVTLAMGLISFVAFEGAGLITGGFAYLKEFIWPGLLIEIISHLFRPVALAVRLFGNITAGEVVLTVISGMAGLVVPVIFMVFELFVGLVQALIFALLTLAFLAMSTAHGAAHHEEHGASGEGAAQH